jgi:hypothetical protein
MVLRFAWNTPVKHGQLADKGKPHARAVCGFRKTYRFEYHLRTAGSPSPRKSKYEIRQ